jgi:hypothetical protein
MALPTTGNISLTQVRAYFNAPANVGLSALRRGGTYVPNVTGTAAVPAAVPVNLRSFIGATIGVTYYHVWGFVDYSAWDSYWGYQNWRNYYEAIRTTSFGDAADAFANKYYSDYGSSGYGTEGQIANSISTSYTGRALI